MGGSTPSSSPAEARSRGDTRGNAATSVDKALVSLASARSKSEPSQGLVSLPKLPSQDCAGPLKAWVGLRLSPPTVANPRRALLRAGMTNGTFSSKKRFDTEIGLAYMGWTDGVARLFSVVVRWFIGRFLAFSSLLRGGVGGVFCPSLSNSLVGSEGFGLLLFDNCIGRKRDVGGVVCRACVGLFLLALAFLGTRASGFPDGFGFWERSE